MSEINFRQDKQDSIKAVVDPKQLTDKDAGEIYLWLLEQKK